MQLRFNNLLLLILVASYSYGQSPNLANTLLEKKIDSVLLKMTITEKIGQTSQRGTSSRVKVIPEE